MNFEIEQIKSNIQCVSTFSWRFKCLVQSDNSIDYSEVKHSEQNEEGKRVLFFVFYFCVCTWKCVIRGKGQLKQCFSSRLQMDVGDVCFLRKTNTWFVINPLRRGGGFRCFPMCRRYSVTAVHPDSRTNIPLYLTARICHIKTFNDPTTLVTEHHPSPDPTGAWHDWPGDKNLTCIFFFFFFIFDFPTDKWPTTDKQRGLQNTFHALHTLLKIHGLF